MKRRCGDCQLCCKLLPVKELAKLANQKCKYQKHGKGCTVYGKMEMPQCCTLWNCRWLLEDRTDDLRRPDRSGYVIDVMPDFVTGRNELTGAEHNMPVIQVWADPSRPGAWRDDAAFMAYVERMALEDRMYTLVREGNGAATFIVAPCLNKDGTWFISQSMMQTKEHTPADMLKAGFAMKMVLQGD